MRYAQSAMDALNIEQLPKARRLELQLKQMVAAYDQLAKESERHVRALQRSVAMVRDGCVVLGRRGGDTLHHCL